jgi:hypothetical protein
MVLYLFEVYSIDLNKCHGQQSKAIRKIRSKSTLVRLYFSMYLPCRSSWNEPWPESFKTPAQYFCMWGGGGAPLDGICTISRKNGGSWDVKAVESFQGWEADFMVVPLVRTDGTAGLLKDDRRNDDMLSRARRHLYVVGHHQSWARLKGSKLWCKFAAKFRPAP